jgi:hypothetical protein
LIEEVGCHIAARMQDANDLDRFADKMIHDDGASLEVERAQSRSKVGSRNASVWKFDEALADFLDAANIAKREIAAPARCKVVINFEEIGTRLVPNVDVSEPQDSFFRRS